MTRRIEKRLLTPLVRFVLPTDCFSCGRPLRWRQYLGACPSCWSALAPLRPPLCAGCGLPRPSATDLLGTVGGHCPRCLLDPPTADGVCGAVAYDETARRFMHRIKFGGRRELLGPLALQLSSTVREAGLARGCTFITPVPSGPLADLRRGFSPSRGLARLLSRKLGMELRRGTISRKILGGGPLKRLGAAGRRRRAAIIFTVTERLDGENVLLVDDVMATGASVESCARLLKAAGAAEVRAAIWGRALVDKDHPITSLDDRRG